MNDCPVCGFPTRRRRDAYQTLHIACECRPALIPCWRELLAVMDALQAQRRPVGREVAA